MVTQSGTNSLHGTVFEFLRNSALDARNFFDQGNTPPFRRNQFGGAAGGPLKKNRAFIFGNYEGFRQALALSNVSVVPDAQARQGLLPNASRCVLNTVARPEYGDAAVYVVLAGAQRPGTAGSNGSCRPAANPAALSYNNPRQSIREDFGTVRTDYNLADRDTLSTSYTIDNGNNLTPDADPLFGSYETSAGCRWPASPKRTSFRRIS